MKVYSTYGSTHGVWSTGWVTVKSVEPDDQIFRIRQLFSHIDFTYKSIKKDLVGCVTIMREMEQGIREEDYDILEGFMKSFLLDVESWHKEKHLGGTGGNRD